jgi:hydrogenase maturation protein HypF
MSEEKNVTIRIKVYGIVQGVGFRPTVARHAAKAGITGSVCNKGPYVEIIAQGEDRAVRYFAELLEKKPPRRAVVLKMDIKSADDRGLSFSSFEIIESEKTKGEIFISPDIAICDDCRRELEDPGDRRYLHPFINCTCCGPRLTILDALPYDRERTSMKMFPMCPVCEREYHSPLSRRYDAQPVCCNDCGPEVYLAGDHEVRGREAITYTRRVISQGGIAAVMYDTDSFDKHIHDTLVAGDGICDREVVEMTIREAPERIRELVQYGVNFDREGGGGRFDLHREGGHSEFRILHHKDNTGAEIQT